MYLSNMDTPEPNLPPTGERIKEAAMIWRGKIYTGRRHCDIIHALSGTVPQTEWPIKGPEGFVTEKGVFVDRIEAARIALAAGQVAVGKAVVKHEFNGRKLFSEDLY